MDKVTISVYRAYTNFLLDQHEFLRENKFDINKLVVGVDSSGKVIEIDDAFPSLDFPMTEIEHEMFYNPFLDTGKALKKYYSKYGYTIDGLTDAALLLVFVLRLFEQPFIPQLVFNQLDEIFGRIVETSIPVLD